MFESSNESKVLMMDNWLLSVFAYLHGQNEKNLKISTMDIGMFCKISRLGLQSGKSGLLLEIKLWIYWIRT